MKTQTYIIMAIILLVCFAAGCSTTQNINTRAGLQTDDKEPFIEEIKGAARTREIKQQHWYFLGEAARNWTYQSYIPRRREGQIQCAPIILLKF